MAAGQEKEVAVTGRETGAGQNLTKKSSDPQKDFAVSATQDVVGVRVGSEASVESGTGPVLPVGGSLSEATKVHNKDLRERDQKELKRRGIGDPLTEDVTVSFSGLRMVSVDDGDEEPRSGGGTFRVKDTLSIRRLTPDEQENFGPAGRARTQRRADDLVKGSGVGGGGNPMFGGQSKGVSNEPAALTGTGRPGVTSTATQQRQATENQGNKTTPAGGGSTSRS